MSQDLWERIEFLFHAALERPPEKRDAFLAAECGSDSGLCRRVEVLLTKLNEAGNFLEKPASGEAEPPAPRRDLVGRQLGPYQIVSPLGAGGMGEVYRAHDVKLGRDVAIKTLPGEFGRDPERLARFRREARTLASLNHPNIAALYGFEEYGEIDCLVLELVEGETLHGPLPVHEAAKCARQVAEALEAAHAKRVIHRDLKPANIKVTAAGVVKVLDFGLAKGVWGPDSDHSTTAASRFGNESLAGLIVGTPGYMSPEQAHGGDVDERTDIWAFGCLLYELLTGERAFPAAPGSAPGAASLDSEPNWRALPAKTPAALRELLRRCLEKDATRRLARISEARKYLEEPRGRSGWSIAAISAGALGAIAAVMLLQRPGARPAIPPVTVPFTTFEGGQYEPQFSPDGTQLAFVWDGEEKNNLDVYILPVKGGGPPRRITTDPASEGSPSWSPDGQSIAFVRYSETPGVSGVFTVPVSGGPERRVTPLTELAHIFDRHLDWSPDGSLLAFADRESPTAPFRIYTYSLSAQRRNPVTSPPIESIGDTGPAFSPDSRTILFRRSSSSAAAEVSTSPAAGGASRRLTFDNTSVAGHDWTQDGRGVVFATRRAGSYGLWRLSVPGGNLQPIGVGQGANFLSISRHGQRMAYSVWAADTNIWRMRIGPGSDRGKPVPLIASTLADTSPQYSPDGRRIAFRSNRSGTDEIWVCDADGRNSVRLTSFGGPLTGTPRWSPDGSQIAFDSRPGGVSHIFAVGAGGGAVRQITHGNADDAVPSWSRDGLWIYFASKRGGEWQVWKVPSDPSRGAEPAQITRHGGFAAFESCDGKWLFYAKGLEVAGLWKVPPGGGEESSVIPAMKAGYWGYWAVAPTGIYFLDPLPGGGSALRLFSSANGTTQQVATTPKEPPYSDSGFALSSDANWILFSQVDHAASNIMLIENFR